MQEIHVVEDQELQYSTNVGVSLVGYVVIVQIHVVLVKHKEVIVHVEIIV